MSKKTIEKINEKIVDPLVKFLKSYIYPFATAFFAILNYSKMRDVLIKNKHENWAIFALVLSTIYVLFTLAFGIFWLFHPDSSK